MSGRQRGWGRLSSLIDSFRIDRCAAGEARLTLLEQLERQLLPSADLTDTFFNANTDHILLGQTTVKFVVVNQGERTSLLERRSMSMCFSRTIRSLATAMMSLLPPRRSLVWSCFI